MQDPEHNPYETGYDSSSLPYIPGGGPTNEPASQGQPSVEQPYTGGEVTQPYPPLPASPAPGLAAAPTIEHPPKRRRPRWIALAALAVLVLVVALVAYGVTTYINRPTPTKTLDAFCNALLHDDYHGAYGQFSKGIQAQFSEAVFAYEIAQDKVVSCSHGDASDAGNSATTNLKLVHSSRGVNQDIVVLTRDSSNNWKINDLRKQT